MADKDWQSLLARGWLTLFNTDLSDAQLKQFEDYLSLLILWNQRINLTSITAPRDIVTKHFLDSLAVAPFISQPHIADVGSGAGFPGIPLAIRYPDLQFVLIDSRHKRVAFLKQVCAQLKLSNVRAVHHRVEDYSAEKPFDHILVRAFAPVSEFLSYCAHLGDNKSLFMAMSSEAQSAAVECASKEFQLAKCHDIIVPGLSAKRCLLCFVKVSNS